MRLRDAFALEQNLELLGQFHFTILASGQRRVVVAGQGVGDQLELIAERLQHIPKMPIHAEAMDQHQWRTLATTVDSDIGRVERLRIPIH